MNLLLLGILIGLLYAWGGMRVLIALDELLPTSRVNRWSADHEWRSWISLVFWPVAAAIDLALHGVDRGLTRWLRKGVRS